MTTKWDLISDDERQALLATPCNVSCSGCGAPFETEADFAKHFVLPNTRYRNLGECPNTERGKAFVEQGRVPDFYKGL